MSPSNALIRQFKHQTERKAQTVIIREYSLLTFDSNVKIGRLALQRNVGTEVEDLRLELRFMLTLSIPNTQNALHLQLVTLCFSTPAHEVKFPLLWAPCCFWATRPRLGCLGDPWPLRLLVWTRAPPNCTAFQGHLPLLCLFARTLPPKKPHKPLIKLMLILSSLVFVRPATHDAVRNILKTHRPEF